jgi:hypothetical protein
MDVDAGRCDGVVHALAEVLEALGEREPGLQAEAWLLTALCLHRDGAASAAPVAASSALAVLARGHDGDRRLTADSLAAARRLGLLTEAPARPVR